MKITGSIVASPSLEKILDSIAKRVPVEFEFACDNTEFKGYTLKQNVSIKKLEFANYHSAEIAFTGTNPEGNVFEIFLQFKSAQTPGKGHVTMD